LGEGHVSERDRERQERKRERATRETGTEMQAKGGSSMNAHIQSERASEGERAREREQDRA
jgi:hypothetical protein